MKITRIQISNFLKLKDVNFNPSETNVIVGKNKQGKTSILKAIRTAFTGDADATSIRVGEHKAEITIEMDSLNIRRSITEKGGTLSVTNKEGMSYPAPQRFLDGILGTFSFNPVEFFDKKPGERKKYLLAAIKMTLTPERLKEFVGMELAGLDFTKHALEVIEDCRKYFYDLRTAANGEKTKKEKALADLNEKIPADFNPRDVSDEKIAELRAAIQKDSEEKIKKDANDKELLSLQTQETETQNEIVRLQEKLKSIQEQIVTVASRTFDVSDDMAMAAAADTLKALEGQREVLYTVKRRDEVRGELDGAIAEADRLDTIVKRLAKEVPQTLITEAKLPVEGLTIEGDELLVNGVNIDNMSSSEQLKLGLQIVRALNGEFKVICVDGIESLDKESFELFLKEAEADDYQYFVTRVDGNSTHSIVVEDGEIKEPTE